MTERRTAPPPAGRERRSPTLAAARKREAIRRLKAALAEQRFVLHYQPIVGASDSRVTRVEALLRWRAPKTEHDDITELLWAAERSPVIFKLEEWTLHEALHAASPWRAGGSVGTRVNVNLSAREFPRANLVRRLKGKLVSAGLEAGAVGLEITETSSMSEFSAVAEQLQRLIAMGIELWLDDFGTGHSSLEWLSHLPCHGVKIAGTFVERLFTEKRCQVIVGRVIDLAHDLGLKVIGEGVETPPQRDFLVDRGCDFLQGYLFHAPMPADEVPLAQAGAGATGR
jgi:EAL domain-containing protein (putative c-di-GMP-specific phosphodiesterase class I)